MEFYVLILMIVLKCSTSCIDFTTATEANTDFFQ